jgi:hypothetical protein
MIRGDKIYVRTISATAIPSGVGTAKRNWQYHSRSDAHSKAACWGIVFDLLTSCPLLREHVETGKVGFGINHEMRDFRMNRKKDLDLVICTLNGAVDEEAESFTDLVARYGIALDSADIEALALLPSLKRGSVGSVLIALEAKACMTAHIKACPRLYDELSSSFQTILGDTKNAVAAAFVTINAASEFVSPVLNKDTKKNAALKISEHQQPKAAKRVLEKIKELPRRSGEDEIGFDALGALFVDCRNDGTEVKIVDVLPDGTAVDTILTYQAMISRIASMYSSRFRAV